ncbi:MAG TPA: OmpA family protein [Agriterribacter sp.]|nr:OmpA family protein [Agriterribacter sp.]
MHHQNISRAIVKLALQLRNAFAVLFICIHSISTVAQTDQTGYFIRGEELFKQKKYYEALQYFEKFLTTEIKTTPRSQPFAVQKKAPGKSNLNVHNEAVYRLAECYRLTYNYTLAEKWYSEAMTFSTKAYPACSYWYGVCLRANQKYDEAFKVITAFRESYNKTDELVVGADKELENLKFIRGQYQKEKEAFFVTRQSLPGNRSAYAQTSTAQGNNVYTTIYEDKAGEGFIAGLQESAESSGNEKGSRVLREETPDVHSGLATFSKDGKKMFFTRWTETYGVTRSAIYSADKTDSGWSKPTLMPEPINMEGSNSAQPFITSDGKYLLFSSNRNGGVGSYDIWYAQLDIQYNALLVTNAGNIINSPDDEVTPSYHQTSRTLLFSSNGHTGMGGYDIFSAKGDFQLSNWDKPLNAGKPINSSKDDLHYISTDEDNLWNTGWLSSDRATDCCLELFSVRQDNAQFISGTVTDCNTRQPLKGVTLTIKDPRKGGKELLRQQTNFDGSYHFELRNQSRFEVTAEMKGYQVSSETFKVFFDAGIDSVNNNNICLSPIVTLASNETMPAPGESATLANFSFNQSALGNHPSYELDSLANFMQQHPSVIIEVGGYTDGKGREAYNLNLAQKRVDACISYLVKKGIPKDRLVGRAYGECCPLEPETINGKDNPAARQRNRRVEYKVVNDN